MNDSPVPVDNDAVSEMPLVLLTRPARQAEKSDARLREAGFRVLLQPMIEIRPPEDWGPVDSAIERLTQSKDTAFDWLIFAGQNGVAFFFDRLFDRLCDRLFDRPFDQLHPLRPGLFRPEHRNDHSFLHRIRIAVVGKGTENALVETISRKADVYSEKGDSEEILDVILRRSVAGKRFLILRANRGRDLYRQPLLDAGAGEVLELPVYRSVDVERADPAVWEHLTKGRIDFTTVSSSAIAASLVRMFGSALRNTALVSISPITSRTLNDSGYPPAFEAEAASMDAMIKTMIAARDKNILLQK